MPSPENSLADTNTHQEEVFGARLRKRFFRRRQGPPPFTKTMWWRVVEEDLQDCSGVSRPAPRFCHTMCATQLETRDASGAAQSPCDGLVFLFGGYDVDSRFNDLWAFSPQQLRWIQKPIIGTLPAARHSHAGVFVYRDQVSSPVVLSSAFVPIPFQAPQINVRAGAGSQDVPSLHTLVPKEPYLIFFGGAIKGGTALDDTLILHIGPEKWTWCKQANRHASDVPPARYGHSMTYCPHMKCIILFGGYNGTQYFSDMWLFHVDSLAWEKRMTTGDKPSPRWSHSAILMGSKLYIFGGRGPNKRLFNDIYVFDTERYDFSLISACGQLPPPMYGHSAVPYRHRMFLVHGGWDEKSMSNDTFLFNTDSIEWFRLDISDPPLGRTCHTSVYFEFPPSPPENLRSRSASVGGGGAATSATAPSQSPVIRSCAIIFGGYSNGRCTNENYMLEYTDLDCKQQEEVKPTPPPLGRKSKRFSFFRGLFDWLKPDEDLTPTTALAETENLEIREEVVIMPPSGYGAINGEDAIEIDEEAGPGGYEFNEEDAINSTTPLRRQKLNQPRNAVPPAQQQPHSAQHPAPLYPHLNNNAFAVDPLPDEDN